MHMRSVADGKGRTDVRALMVLVVSLQRGFDLARATQVVVLLGWNMRMFDIFSDWKLSEIGCVLLYHLRFFFLTPACLVLSCHCD